MQIFNVRLGLATNSSSSHSLVWLPENVKAVDYMGWREPTIFPDEVAGPPQPIELGDFGWQHFTLASREAKMRYLGTLLRDRLAESLPHNVQSLIVKSWLGTNTADEDDIDHESWMYLPSAFGSKIPDERLVKEIADYFCNERLVILGGNDNQSVKHPLHEYGAFRLPLPHDCRRSNYVCRYDEEYKFWVIFNQEDGTKIRFRLTRDPAQMKNVPVCASTPELVDIKITDQCGKGCEYCYQNSNVNGQQANRFWSYLIAQHLAELQVFEVSLGGGEPTIHPEFMQYLKGFREVGIVPNFTTRNLAWLRDPYMAHGFMEFCGAFALSVNKEEEVKNLVTLLDYNSIDHNKAAVQVVLGTIESHHLAGILRACADAGVRATLLGFKSVGRGANYQPRNYRNWLEIVKDSQAKVSIDTALAAEYQQQILAAGISPYMFDVKEGAFSCYIDLVQNKIGPSSFCKPEEMLPLESDEPWDSPERLEVDEMILRAFRQFNSGVQEVQPDASGLVTPTVETTPSIPEGQTSEDT